MKSLEDGLGELLKETGACPETDERNFEKATKANGKGKFAEKKTDITEEKSKDAESLLISARQKVQGRNKSLQNK